MELLEKLVNLVNDIKLEVTTTKDPIG